LGAQDRYGIEGSGEGFEREKRLEIVVNRRKEREKKEERKKKR